MQRINLGKGLLAEEICLEFACNKCNNVWTEWRPIKAQQVIDSSKLKCPKCKSHAISIIYPTYQL